MLSFTDSLGLHLMHSYFFSTLRENTLACGIILVARQRISNVVSRSFPLFTLLQEQHN